MQIPLPLSLFTSLHNYFNHMDAREDGFFSNQHDYWLIYPQTFLPPSPSPLHLHIPFSTNVAALLALFSLLFPELNFIVSSPTTLSS